MFSFRMKRLLAIASGLACTVAVGALFSQQPAGNPPPQQKKKGNFRPPSIEPIVETGYTSLFDGTSLKGWEGNTDYWRAEGGSIVGQTTAEKPLKVNTFLIYRGGTLADFSLKLQYKLNGFNSGIQIRSVELPDIKFAMKGYQADIDGEQRYTGQFYEERGRGFLAMRGQFTWINPAGKPELVSSFGGNDELKALIKTDDWNDVELIARGNNLTQIINGRVMSQLIDDDTNGRKMEGLLGLQIHVGPPMKIEYRNIRVKKL